VAHTEVDKRDSVKARRKRPFIIEFYSSDVGKKWAMALSGILLLGYLVAHLLGNLKVFLGPENVDLYAEALRDLGGELVPRQSILWLMRIGLLLAYSIHVHAALSLWWRNRKARGSVGYQTRTTYLAATYASRFMAYTGITVFLFILFHLSDLTWGPANPDFVYGDVYANIVATFERVPVAILYIVAILALGAHVRHGAWSLFQSIGINNAKFNKWRNKLAYGLTAFIVLGNISIPLAVQFGILKL